MSKISFQDLAVRNNKGSINHNNPLKLSETFRCFNTLGTSHSDSNVCAGELDPGEDTIWRYLCDVQRGLRLSGHGDHIRVSVSQVEQWSGGAGGPGHGSGGCQGAECGQCGGSDQLQVHPRPGHQVDHHLEEEQVEERQRRKINSPHHPAQETV